MKALTLPIFAGCLALSTCVFAAAAENADAKEKAPAGENRTVTVDRRVPPGRPAFERGMPGGNNGNWLGRFLSKPENLAKVGIEGEKKETLVKELAEINARQKELSEKIMAESREQGKLASTIMEKPGECIKPILEKVKAIGDMRTEQAVLSTKVLAVLRDNLTKEQRDQVRQLMIEEGRNRMEARRNFNEGMERRRPEFGNRRGRRGRSAEGAAAEATAEKPAPAAEAK